MEWKPIETAPKGHDVLLWSPRLRIMVADWGDYAGYNHPRFTHWMPLPAPPEAPDMTRPGDTIHET